MNTAITKLVNYAVKNGLMEECDRVYAVNRLIEALGLDAGIEITLTKKSGTKASLKLCK